MLSILLVGFTPTHSRDESPPAPLDDLAEREGGTWEEGALDAFWISRRHIKGPSASLAAPDSPALPRLNLSAPGQSVTSPNPVLARTFKEREEGLRVANYNASDNKGGLQDAAPKDTRSFERDRTNQQEQLEEPHGKARTHEAHSPHHLSSIRSSPTNIRHNGVSLHPERVLSSAEDSTETNQGATKPPDSDEESERRKSAAKKPKDGGSSSSRRSSNSEKRKKSGGSGSEPRSKKKPSDDRIYLAWKEVEVTALEAIKDEPDLTMLAGALDSSPLTAGDSIINRLAVTVFAPTDEALRSLPVSLEELDAMVNVAPSICWR